MIKDNSKIFIINSPKDKPVKIIFEEQPCPIYLQLGQTFRCKNAKWESGEEYEFKLCCTDMNNCEHISY